MSERHDHNSLMKLLSDIVKGATEKNPGSFFQVDSVKYAPIQENIAQEKLTIYLVLVKNTNTGGKIISLNSIADVPK